MKKKKNRYKNISEENKQRLKEYQKYYRRAEKINTKDFCLFFLYMV